MKLYLVTTEDKTFITAAASPWEAEARVIAVVYPDRYDDDLSDLIHIEHVNEEDVNSLKGGDITII